MSLKRLGRFLRERSPEILTGIGISGFIGSMILLNKAAPVARDLIEERKLDEEKDKLTVKETIQTTWKVYAPVIVTATGATACIIGGAAQNYKRNAALAAAYGLSQETLSIYRQKVVEALGEKREQEIRQEADKEVIERHPVGFEVNPSPPDTLFFYEGRYFYSNWAKIRAVVNDLGEYMLDSPQEPSASLNDFFESVGLSCTMEGDRQGWNMYINGRPELYVPTCIELDNHQICMVLSFSNPPIDLYTATRKLR